MHFIERRRICRSVGRVFGFRRPRTGEFSHPTQWPRPVVSLLGHFRCFSSPNETKKLGRRSRKRACGSPGEKPHNRTPPLRINPFLSSQLQAKSTTLGHFGLSLCPNLNAPSRHKLPVSEFSHFPSAALMLRQPFFGELSALISSVSGGRKKPTGLVQIAAASCTRHEFIQVHAALETLWTLTLLASGPSDETSEICQNSRQLAPSFDVRAL